MAMGPLWLVTREYIFQGSSLNVPSSSGSCTLQQPVRGRDLSVISVTYPRRSIRAGSTDIVLLFFFFFVVFKNIGEPHYPLALAVNKSPSVYILSPALDGLWRENRVSVKRLDQQCLSSKTSKDKVGKFFYDEKREIIFVRFRLDISGDVKGLKVKMR